MRKFISILLSIAIFQIVFGCGETPTPAGKPFYTNEYIQANSGKVEVSIPEMLELSQIAMSLTDYKDKTREGAYWSAVQTHFNPYKTHPLIAKLNSRVTDVSSDYALRAGAFATEFDRNGNLVAGFYPNESSNDIFGSLKDDFSDFAKKSNFQTFYQNQKPLYEELKNKQSQLMPIRKMWDWLELRFPARSQSYKVIFSPLIGGNHNVRWYGNATFRESLMFVSYVGDCCQGVSQQAKEGLASRVVFTEIDHSYVNPVSDENKAQIDKFFQDRSKWTGGKDADNYRTPHEVFNEYMT